MYNNTCNNVPRLVQKTTFSLPRSYTECKNKSTSKFVDNNMGSSIKKALPCLHLQKTMTLEKKTYINDHGQVKEAYIQLACLLSVKFFFKSFKAKIQSKLANFRRTAQWFCYVKLIPRDMYSMLKYQSVNFSRLGI